MRLYGLKLIVRGVKEGLMMAQWNYSSTCLNIEPIKLQHGTYTCKSSSIGEDPKWENNHLSSSKLW